MLHSHMSENKILFKWKPFFSVVPLILFYILIQHWLAHVVILMPVNEPHCC